jgi:hypothetical protein
MPPLTVQNPIPRNQGADDHLLYRDRKSRVNPSPSMDKGTVVLSLTRVRCSKSKAPGDGARLTEHRPRRTKAQWSGGRSRRAKEAGAGAANG